MQRFLSNTDKKGDYYIMDMDKSISIFSAMSDGVLLIRKGGKVDYINPAANRILNVAQNISDVTNLLDSLMCHKINDSFIDVIVNAVFEEGETQQSLVQYQNPDQHGKNAQVKMLEVKTSYSSENGQACMLILLTDVTQREEKNSNCRDSSIIIAVLLGFLFLYAFATSLISLFVDILTVKAAFTWMLLLVGSVACFVTYHFTSLSLSKSGMRLSNLKSGLKMALLYIPIIVGVFILLKFIILQLFPQINPDGKPFFNWNRYMPGGITIWHILYPLSSFMQEFLARIFVHDNIARIFEVYGKKKAGVAAIILSSLLFACVHMHQGFIFMMGAFILSIFLGIFYYKSSNFWFIVFVHCIVGDIASSLMF